MRFLRFLFRRLGRLYLIASLLGVLFATHVVVFASVGDWVTVMPSQTLSLSISGDYAAALPAASPSRSTVPTCASPFTPGRSAAPG